MASRRGLGKAFSPPEVLILGCLVAFLAAPLQAQQIQVTAADPPAAEQGTVNLNVSIKGKGFKKGATASFVLTGTDDPDGIAVNSTTFVSAGELIANINVAETATITKFDIKVRNSDGRIGKGTELFSVIQKSGNNSSAIPVSNTIADTTAGQPHSIQSDQQGPYSGYSNGQTDSIADTVFIGTGDWQLDLRNSVTRQVFVDLSGFVSGSTTQPHSGSYAALLSSRCFNSSGFADGGYPTLTSAGSAKTNCGLRTVFSDGATKYALVLSPPKSGHSATVTCLADNGNPDPNSQQCVQWKLAAEPTAAGEANAVMLKLLKGGKEVEIGRYVISFDITITRN